MDSQFSTNQPFTFERKNLNNEQLSVILKNLLEPRLIEEKMLILLRQGKISKWFSGIGQEAISVGVTMALEEDEYILPTHRNLGVFTTRNIPFYRLFAQWQGKASGFTKGRDRSFHFGSQEFKIIGMISHLGPQLGVADGIALAHQIRNEKKVTAVFTGEGGTSEGDFHEALNIASVWQLPVLFCIENNGYALSTPTSEQYYCKDLADRAVGYGMESQILDGNNILEVYHQIEWLAQSMRENPRPVLVEFKTFRMRGHEEASGTKYVPEEIMVEWSKKDPVWNFKKYLIKESIFDHNAIQQIEEGIKAEIESHLQQASSEPSVIFNEINELNDVYQPFDYQEINSEVKNNNIRFIDAIAQGLKQSMQRHDNLILMGQDIAEYGGVFKITAGLLDEFGSERVRNIPICESGIVETAMGLSINGMNVMVEMQFADFVSSGFNPIVNYLAKTHYRWGQSAKVVIRMPCGAGVGAGPFHSQSNEAWFTKVPGIKVAYPAFPYDAKGLLNTAFNDPNPVLFFEHKALYRNIKGEVPVDYYTIPFGKANLIRQGGQVSIITYGAGVHWVLEVLEQQPDIDADLLDLRSLQPLDRDSILHTVRKTGKVIILQEDTMFGGIASDLAAFISEEAFEYLDAPVRRVGSLETPIPFAAALEEGFLPKQRFSAVLLELLKY